MLRAAAIVGVLVDIDAMLQPELAAENSLELRWRCFQAHFALPIADALATNYSGLGWSTDLVRPLTGNLTGCQELMLDDLHGPSLLPPFATALSAGCPEVGDESRPWEPARAAVPLRLLDFEGSELGDAGAAAVGPILHACPFIAAVYAPMNRISDEGARALATALFEPPHPAVRQLDLHGNRIHDYGADGLARLLTLPPSAASAPVPLRELRLHNNRIGAHGFSILAEALRDNVLLETLMLSHNPGGDLGVAALASALAERRKAGRDAALRRLYLTAVNLTDVGAVALLDALRAPNAPPLETLVLDGNPAVSQGMLHAIEALMAPRRAAATAREEHATGLFRARELQGRGSV